MGTLDVQEAGVMFCKICGHPSSAWSKALILNKHNVQYYSCSQCGFIQTEFPYWMDEAYSSAIARSDIGLIGRNIKLSSFCSSLIPMFYNSKLPFLDYGGGNGMFVRMMRDRGFEFYWRDIYASNQFAEGFEASQDKKFSLITAFEVFEHLPQPLETIEDMFHYSDTLVFSTRLLPRWKIAPDDWWYFTLDTGQHVSLYSRESLEWIAKKFKVRLSSNGISLHVLSPRTVPAILLKALSYPPFAMAASGLLNISRKSLLEDDYYRLTGRRLI
ncbi:MAG: class I SAM-dependent methyltransferase [Anaerolineales bacterium]|nr:class I SAM-dependent methyltransferase [Anaerolineales bacterium]